MTLPNPHRGEVMIEIDGAPRTLCVTLGALAALEAAFDVGSFAELGERLATLTASDLLIVLAALLDDAPTTPSELAHAHVDPRQAAVAVAEAFRLAFAA